MIKYNFENELMKHSCGALIYSFNELNEIGVILGDEGAADKAEWLTFKGGPQNEETLEQAACREIYEETCGLVSCDKIELSHKFSTKRKNYHIGLIYADYSIIESFDRIIKEENRKEFKEKKSLKFFSLKDLTASLYEDIHSISRASIRYYMNYLLTIASNKILNQNKETSSLNTVDFGKNTIDIGKNTIDFNKNPNVDKIPKGITIEDAKNIQNSLFKECKKKSSYFKRLNMSNANKSLWRV